LLSAGYGARVIDKAEAASTTSRAQVVNPRALEMLEASGVTTTVLAEARPISSARFYKGWRRLAELDFAEIPSRFAMSVLPQARTEALLAAGLKAHGIEVERKVALESFTEEQNGMQAVLTHRDGHRETTFASYLFVADGAHTVVRDVLHINFSGHAFPEEWPLFDVELNDPLPIDHAHVEFVESGLVFLLCIRPGLWRGFGDVPKPLEHLPSGSRLGEVKWESTFHISDRLADRLVRGRVALAGDGEAARALALGWVGLARLALFHIRSDIEAGRLIPVLQDFNPGD